MSALITALPNNLFFIERFGANVLVTLSKTGDIEYAQAQEKDVYSQVGQFSPIISSIFPKEYFSRHDAAMASGLIKEIRAHPKGHLPQKVFYAEIHCSGISAYTTLTYQTNDFAWYFGTTYYNAYMAVIELDREAEDVSLKPNNAKQYLRPDFVAYTDHIIKTVGFEGRDFFSELYQLESIHFNVRERTDDAITYVVQEPNVSGLFSYDPTKKDITWLRGNNYFVTPIFSSILSSWCQGVEEGKYLVQNGIALIFLERIAEVMHEEEMLGK